MMRFRKLGWWALIGMAGVTVVLASCDEKQKYYNAGRAELRVGNEVFHPQTRFLRDPPQVVGWFNLIFDLGKNGPIPSDCMRDNRSDCIWVMIDEGGGMGRRNLFLSTSLQNGDYRIFPVDDGLIRFESRHRRDGKVVGQRHYISIGQNDNFIISCWEKGLSYSEGTICEGWLLENGLDIHFVFPTRYISRWREIIRGMRMIIKDARHPSSTSDFGDRQ